jgi:ketosteroid isomerase-like protein
MVTGKPRARTPGVARALVSLVWRSAPLRAWLIRTWPAGRARRALVDEYFARVYAQINRRRGLPRGHLHPEFVLRFPFDVGILGGIETLHGPDAIRQMFEVMEQAFTQIEWVPERVLEAPDGRFVALVRMTATGGGSGVALDEPVAIVASFRDGRIAEGTMYMDRKQALADARLGR